jgi:catechol 2,3-dioxygenase-like lactoylglutathione lyase family enzyme
MSKSKDNFNKSVQLTHIALPVQDIQQSTDFYKRWAEMSVVHQHDSDVPGQPVTWLSSKGQEDNFVIVLVPSSTHNIKEEGMRHLGFAVHSKDDVMNICKNAKKEGILHWDYQEFGYPVGTLCSVKDPDGYIVEFSFGQPLGRDFKADKQGQKQVKKSM